MSDRHWQWLSNAGLAALVATAFVDSWNDALKLATGAALGLVFGIDLMRGRRG